MLQNLRRPPSPSEFGTKTDHMTELTNGPPFDIFEVGNSRPEIGLIRDPPPFGKFPTLYRFLDLIASLSTYVDLLLVYGTC